MFALILTTALSAFAQVRGGNISGTAKDEQGGVLPGASVTAQGLDATLAATTDADGHYRFLDLAPGPYKVTVDLAGFASVVRDAIVAVGRSADVTVTMGLAARRESIAVIAAAPMVDPKITGTAINFTSDELTRIPTSRDPFALFRGVPGVLLDQVNIGGNETGQQAIVVGKGTRQQDTSWTLDGVEITDMSAPGQSPTYFNFDSFDEVQVSTAGNDIRSRTGGASINMVTKRGTNKFRGGLRSYFSDTRMESSNVPDELKLLATPVTPDTADHTAQTSDYGFEMGGPILQNKAWFYASLSQQDIRVFRRSTNAIDRTKLKDAQIKVNWQATKKDMINFLFFNGYKLKDGRTNNGGQSEAYEATLHQDNAYSDNPLHGMWKVADDRVISSNMFLSAKYAYYNTGIKLTPEGGVDTQAGKNLDSPTRAYGSTSRSLLTRPQHSVTADMNHFVRLFGNSHDLKYGVGFRRVLSQTQVEWPGNGVLAIEQSGATAGTSSRAQVFRESNGANVVKYADLYVGDTLAFRTLTLDVAVRYDRQWGEALPSTIAASQALPSVVPGVVFAGYSAPFVWTNFSPRVGVSYVLDSAGKTVARASYSRFAGQLAASTVGTRNLTTGSAPGSATYPWTDLNGDHYAQADEVNTSGTPITTAGGFNAADPTALVSTSQVDPNLKAPITQSVVVGIERELMPSLAVMVNYSYNRTTNLFGNLGGNLTPRVGIPLSSYVLAASSPLTGTLPDGTAYSVPVYTTPAGSVNNGIVIQNAPGYYVDYNGLELNVIKRLSNRWMGRVTLGYNNSREHFSDPTGRYNTNGNPTPKPLEPLQDGGQYAPTSSITTGIFMNSKWQVNVNGMVQAPYGIEIAANVFGRQGYPFPIYRSAIALGLDTNQDVLVAPIDTFRLGNVWDTDLRLGRPFKVQAGAQTIDVRLVADVFNLFNANTELARNGNIGSATTFGVMSKNVSPRIVRLGLVVGF